ncbi:hypothetical protein F4818DRAFT_34604 [Hypoxylon cercidicola]|nr:hypothetical protein F4818DRAFT_34604 [Hypoxylon cercidicola]
MIYFFNGIWPLSEGNWYEFDLLGEKPGRKLWTVAFFLSASLTLWHGLRFGNSTTKGFGIAYLAINLVTKGLNFLWDARYKTPRFAVLALLFGILGWYAERASTLLNGPTRISDFYHADCFECWSGIILFWNNMALHETPALYYTTNL